MKEGREVPKELQKMCRFKVNITGVACIAREPALEEQDEY